MSAWTIVQLAALAAGGLLILLIRKRYRKMRRSEAVLIFVLYAVLIALFTPAVVDWIREMVG